jgi:AcrR family transcriptional regulator
MKHVAREAGVSQGILHYYFATKRAMLIGALETVTAELNHRLAQLLDGAHDPRTQLGMTIRGYLEFASQHRLYWIVFVEF